MFAALFVFVSSTQEVSEGVRQRSPRYRLIMPEPVRNSATPAGDRFEMLQYFRGSCLFSTGLTSKYAVISGKKNQLDPMEGSK